MSIYQVGKAIMRGGGLLLNVTATASNSAVMPTGTTGVYVQPTVACFIDVGVTASDATGLYLTTAQSMWLPIAAGMPISGVRSAADGILYIKPTVG